MNESATASASITTRRRGLFALALFICLFSMYVLTGSKLRFGYEGSIINQTEALLRGTTAPRLDGGGILPVTQGGVMDVAAYIPFAAVKLALDRSGRLFGLRQLIYPLAIPFYTAFFLVLFYFLALELYRNAKTAAGLTLILGLATMIWPYAKFGMETQQTLWTIAGTLALLRYQRRPSGAEAAALGGCLALLLLTKITGPLNAAALATAWGWSWLRQNPERRRQSLAHLALVAAVASAGLLAFLFTNHWRYGGWIYGGRYGLGHETNPYPILSGIWAVLFSTGKSIFLFSPALALGLWFWGGFWRRFPGMRLLLVLLVLIGLWHIHMRPWADETWGPRRLHYLVPFLALPIGLWIENRFALRRWVRALGLGAIALGVWVQLIAVAVDYTALARVFDRTELMAIEKTVWEPALSPIGFNLHVLASVWQRQRTGKSIPYFYELHFMPWTGPYHPPAGRFYPLRGQDKLDFWVVQQRQDWAGRPYWFVAGSFYLWLGFAALGLASGWWLYLLARNVDCGIRNVES